MDPILPSELANAVTGFATVFAGLTALALSFLIGKPPLRWLAVYAAIFVTGVPTVWYHGYGEQLWQGVADIGTNLLLGWLLVVAALWDGYSVRMRLFVASGMAGINLFAIAFRIYVGFLGINPYIVDLGEFGGFHLGEVVLIVDSLLAVCLLYGRLRHLSQRAKNVLYTFTVVFIAGALLASAGNHEVYGRIFAFHALWHLVGAFGFILLWGFNYVRFHIDRLD